MEYDSLELKCFVRECSKVMLIGSAAAWPRVEILLTSGLEDLVAWI